MRTFFILIIFFLVNGCNKPKTVMICGDHVCINKAEANQYFEDNLSIEVKIVDNNKRDEIDLVELSLRQHSKGKRKVRVKKKISKQKSIKALSNKEIEQIKKNIKNKKKKTKIAKKIVKKKDINKEKIFIKSRKIKKNKIKESNNKIIQETVNNKRQEIVDVCSILEKCSIDEISKYLLEQGVKKDFPDITLKE